MLTVSERDDLRRVAARSAGWLGGTGSARQLVHSDFNPKNVLAQNNGGLWTVSAVVDWEFAFSGSPMVDIGNMLRFEDELPASYSDGFLMGFVTEGSQLPRDWRRMSQALDLFALADFLARPSDNFLAVKVVNLLRRKLSEQ